MTWRAMPAGPYAKLRDRQVEVALAGLTMHCPNAGCGMQVGNLAADDAGYPQVMPSKYCSPRPRVSERQRLFRVYDEASDFCHGPCNAGHIIWCHVTQHMRVMYSAVPSGVVSALQQADLRTVHGNVVRLTSR